MPPSASADGIWPHGRWRFDFAGRADHAGTTRLADRRDPMLPYAATVLAAREAAERSGALATFGKVAAEPGAANAISSSVHAWLDARAPDEATLDQLVSEVWAAAQAAAGQHGVAVRQRRESVTPQVSFDRGLRDRLVGVLGAAGIAAPVLPTGAGTRRRRARGADPGSDAVRAQPERHLALARRARRDGRLRGRGVGPDGSACRPGGPVTAARAWLAELAWSPDFGLRSDVLIEAAG